jgi:hypothetical protein
MGNVFHLCQCQVAAVHHSDNSALEVLSLICSGVLNRYYSTWTNKLKLMIQEMCINFLCGNLLEGTHFKD